VKPLSIISEGTMENKKINVGKLFIWAMYRDHRKLTILA
jgi:hypothetical protein